MMKDEINLNNTDGEGIDSTMQGVQFTPSEKDIWRACVVIYMLLTNDIQPRSKGNVAYISYNYC